MTMATVATHAHVHDRRQAGFSLIELMVSMSLMLVVTGAIFQLVGSGQNAFRTQPAVADVHQRLRVAADMIYKDLLSAGAGPYLGANPGALSDLLPPIRPQRQGAIDPDSDLSYAPDRITIIHVPRTRAQTVLASDTGGVNEDLRIAKNSPRCPAGGVGEGSAPCHFEVGMRGLIFDATGVGAGYDLFTMTSVGTSDLGHGGFNPSFSRTYAANDARVTEVEQHVYYLDQTNARLHHYDGYETDLVLVDDVVDLRFTYYANPNPGSIPPPANGLGNCVYAAGTPPVPILPVLNAPTLTPLTAGQLTDGPICGLSPNRFDGDLLRVQKIGVAITVQVARPELRGDDPDQFRNRGSARSGEAWVPDYTMRFEVTPRNMNLLR